LVELTKRLFAEGTKQSGCHNQKVWWLRTFNWLCTVHCVQYVRVIRAGLRHWSPCQKVTGASLSFLPRPSLPKPPAPRSPCTLQQASSGDRVCMYKHPKHVQRLYARSRVIEMRYVAIVVHYVEFLTYFGKVVDCCLYVVITCRPNVADNLLGYVLFATLTYFYDAVIWQTVTEDGRRGTIIARLGPLV
jgi:hypothetical protein